jgi:AcrR family transcriptional regulator
VSYHHGQLAPALVAAGLALARAGGTDAVTLREATRAVGVTPRAAYRHFENRQALVDAVACAAHGHLADVITSHQERIGSTGDQRAGDVLRAVGSGYVEFARTEPGWFDVAFFGLEDMLLASSPQAVGRAGRTPFQQLEDAVAGLVEAGALAADQSESAAIFCWSTVHGFAVLASKGPLRGLGPYVDELSREVIERAVDGTLSRR